MILKVKVLASGSTGNCYLLEGVETRLLIDAGINYDKILKKVDFNMPSAVLITHSHMDHAKSAKKFLQNGGAVFCSVATGMEMGIQSHCLYRPIKAGESFDIGEFAVYPLQMTHGVECLGFVITDGEEIVLFFSDTDSCNYNISGLTQLYVECNYSMEDIADDTADAHAIAAQQHMSLEDLLLFLGKTDLSKVKKIVLIHNSESNLDKNRAIEKVQNQTGIPTFCANKNGGES